MIDNQKHQRVGEILMTSESVGLYICCACELSLLSSSTSSSSSSSSTSSKCNGNKGFTTKEVDAFWEHIRCHHRSPDKVCEKTEQRSPTKQIENSSTINKHTNNNKAQENNSPQEFDIIVIDDDEDERIADRGGGGGGDSDTSIEDALEKMMGEGTDLEKELQHASNEEAISLDKMISEAYEKDELEIILIDDDDDDDDNIEEEQSSYHSKSEMNNDNNLISTELLKNFLDINKSPTNAIAENKKGNNTEELNAENIPNEPMDCFDDDCETIVNGDLESTFRRRKDHLLNAKRDSLEQFLSSQNLDNIQMSANEANKDNMENGYGQVDPAPPQTQIQISFQIDEQMMYNNNYQNGMCSQPQQQFQFATTAATTSPIQIITTTAAATNAIPMQFATTTAAANAMPMQYITTTTSTPSQHTPVTPFSTITTPLQRTEPIQFPPPPPPTTTTITTPAIIGSTVSTHHTESSIQQNTNNLQGSTSATRNKNNQTMPTSAIANDLPPLQCDFCPDRFYASWQKILHETMHESNNNQAVPATEAPSIQPLQCDFCPERFSASWQKIRHEKVHFLRHGRKARSNDVPLISKYNSREYKCNRCGLRTVSEEGLRLHWQHYHPAELNAELQQRRLSSQQQKPGYECQECTLVYKHKQSLKNHIQRHHPESSCTPDLSSKNTPPPSTPSSNVPSPSPRDYNRTPAVPPKDPSVVAHCLWHLQSSYQPALDSHDSIESFGTLYHKKCAT